MKSGEKAQGKKKGGDKKAFYNIDEISLAVKCAISTHLRQKHHLPPYSFCHFAGRARE